MVAALGAATPRDSRPNPFDRSPQAQSLNARPQSRRDVVIHPHLDFEKVFFGADGRAIRGDQITSAEIDPIELALGRPIAGESEFGAVSEHAAGVDVFDREAWGQRASRIGASLVSWAKT